MSRTISQILANSETFQIWLDRTNEALDAFSDAVTVQQNTAGDVTSGNGFVVGTFGSTVLTANTVRGGNVDTTATLTVTSNVNFTSEQVNVASNAYFEGANVQFNSNSTVTAFKISGNSTATNTQIGGTDLRVLANTIFSGSITLPANISVTDTLTVVAVSANGGVGTDGQVFTSNGSVSYWDDPNVTTTDISDAIDALKDSPPADLDTLNKIAAAINDDADFANTVTTALAGKASSSHAHSGSDITSGTVAIAHLPEASYVDFRANTADKLLSTDQVWAAAAFVTMTDGATITPNFANGWNFTVSLGGNRTLANPINWRGGQSGVILIAQDATGSRTLSYGSMWKFPQTPVLTATPGTIDAFAYTVCNDALILCSFIGRVW